MTYLYILTWFSLSVFSAFDQKHGVQNNDSRQEFTFTIRSVPIVGTVFSAINHSVTARYSTVF